MARDLSDTRWNDAKKAWQRLLWARLTHGSYPSAASFARAVHMKEHTYKAYERDPDSASKYTTLDFENAVAWADLLGVRWEWLLEGRGAPWPSGEKTFSPDAQSVAELVDQAPEAERAELVAAIKTLLKRTG